MAAKRRIDKEIKQREREVANRDPITDEPGSHPVGTGVGAMAGGAAAGALAGAMGGGPIGIGAGAVVGAVLGGMAGHDAAEVIDPTIEHNYWRQHFFTRPYAVDSAVDDYERYAPAYQYGWEGYYKYGKNEDGTPVDFSQAQSRLRNDWERDYPESDLEWEVANKAMRDAWERVQNAIPAASSQKRRPK